MNPPMTKVTSVRRHFIKRTIEICKEEDILSDYLQSREKEVIDMMEALFNQEIAFENHVTQREREADLNARIQIAINFKGKMPDETLAENTGLPLETVKSLQPKQD